jgi:hypothetical protein
MSFRVMSVGKFAVAALMISTAAASARDTAHLIPVEPVFGSDEPYASTYARLVEERLFAGSNWVVRYHFVSKAEIGLSITRRQDGSFLLTVKQTKPALEYVVTNAYRKYLKGNLKTALETVKFHEAHAEIPETTVTAIRKFWISLLIDVQPLPPASRNKTLVLGTKVTLFAKTAGEKILQGELPADASEHSRLSAIEDIVDDLVSVCVKPKSTHKMLFERIERKAQSYTDHGAAYKKEQE